MNLADLPHSLAPAKQIFEPDFYKTILNLFLLPILIGLLIYLIYYFYKAQKKMDKGLKTSTVIDANALAQKLKKLKFNYGINYQYREALHILSNEMRNYLTIKTGESFLELTSYEIKKKLADKEIENFFYKLTQHQFQKSDVMKFEFEECFDLAIKILEIRRINLNLVRTIGIKQNV